MSQNQPTSSTDNNFIIPLITILLLGGIFCGVAFMVFNQLKNSNENLKTPSSQITNSSSVSSALVASSSIIQSSIIVPSVSSSSLSPVLSSAVEVKKDIIKPAEPEKPKTTEEVKPVQNNVVTKEPIAINQLPSKDIKFKNMTSLKQLSNNELNCMGNVNIGERGYKANYGNSRVLINQLKNLESISPTLSTKFFGYLYENKLVVNESVDLGKYENAGYGLFGCSNYASNIAKIIPVQMKNVDNVKAYLSFGSQGGLPSPDIEIYFKKGNNIARISKSPIDFKITEGFGNDCNTPYGLKPETRECYFNKIYSVLTDQYLQSKVNELVELYSVEF